MRRAHFRTVPLLLTAALILVALPADGRGPIRGLTSTPPLTSGGQIPATMQPRMNADLAADDVAYAVVTLPGSALRATNPAQRLTATFAPDGVTLAGQSGIPWRVALAALGDGTAETAVAAATPVAAGARVEYRRGAVTEWYVNGPLGLEQGFTIMQQPTAGGALSLSLALSGVQATPDGDGALLTAADGTATRYAGLVATDAHGATLSARLAVDSAGLRIVVTTAGAAWPVTVDPFFETNVLAASDPATKDWLGSSVAVDQAGDIIVAGAPAKVVNGLIYGGAVYIWHMNNPLAPKKLTASDGGDNEFGASVAVSADGTVVAVGAPGKLSTPGKAYVYSGLNYATETKIPSPSNTAGDQFGFSVSLNGAGTTLAVGAIGVNGLDNGSGAGAVYLLSGADFATVTPVPDPDFVSGNYDDFGYAVALSSDGGTLVVGAPEFNSARGKVYIYTIPGLAVVGRIASDAGQGDALGQSVAVSGNGGLVAAGAPQQAGSVTYQGAAYLFSGANHATQTKLNNPTPAQSDTFGYAVAVGGNGTTVAIGTAHKDAVYTFTGAGAPLQTLTGTAPSGAQLGFTVALSGDESTLAAGAPAESVTGRVDAGKVHLFKTGSPPTPTNLHVTGATYNSLTWSWSESDATAPLIYTVDGVHFYGLAAGTTTFILYGIAYGSYACMSIAAYDSGAASGYTPYSCSYVQPIAPYNPHQTAGTTSTGTISWANYDTLSYEQVYDYAGAAWHQVGVNGTSYTLTGIPAGYYHCAAVQAYNVNYASGYSYACPFATPNAPTNIHATSVSSTQVTFAWDAPDPYSWYYVYETSPSVGHVVTGTQFTTTHIIVSGQHGYACIYVGAGGYGGTSATFPYACAWAY